MLYDADLIKKMHLSIMVSEEGAIRGLLTLRRASVETEGRLHGGSLKSKFHNAL